MQREPLHLRSDDLRCYSFCHDSTDSRCRSCALRESCSDASLHWQDPTFASLAERARSLEDELATPTLDRASIERVYVAEYKNHFGRRPRLRKDARTNATFGRLLSMCLQEDVDPAAFIAANMEALREAPQVKRFGFQPNMLSGEKAKGRYNGRLRRANRRYRRGCTDAMGSERERIRDVLFLGEYEVAELYVRSRYVGDPITWDAAVASAAPTEAWYSFQRRRGDAFMFLARVGSAEKEAELARMKAACAIAESFQVGLSYRVAAPQLSWDEFAELLCDLFPRRVVPVPTVRGAVVWPVVV